MAKKILSLLFVNFALLSCTTFSNDRQNNYSISTSYCTEEELARRKSPYSLFTEPDQWNLQYPSGSKEEGMKTSPITENFKSKYFSLYKNEKGAEYIRFSLDASDLGKSPNGSSVRTELRHKKEWTLNDKATLSYTFYFTTTDFTDAKFTAGQFLMHCTTKDSPLCRIEIENGIITAVVNNYQSDGITKADGQTHRYNLGTVKQNQEVTIKIEINKKILKIYRNSEQKAQHQFPETVNQNLTNYFKAGIYYQNKNSPKIFTELYLKNLTTEIQN